MAQKTAWNAATLTEADINLYLMGEGGAWTSWTPVVTQSVNVTFTNTRSRFARYSRTIHFVTSMTVTGTGTASNAIAVSTPVTAAAGSVPVGQGWVFDNSAGIGYIGIAQLVTTTTFSVIASGAGGNFLGAQTMTAGLASGDIIYLCGTYEAAS